MNNLDIITIKGVLLRAVEILAEVRKDLNIKGDILNATSVELAADKVSYSLLTLNEEKEAAEAILNKYNEAKKVVEQTPVVASILQPFESIVGPFVLIVEEDTQVAKVVRAGCEILVNLKYCFKESFGKEWLTCERVTKDHTIITRIAYAGPEQRGAGGNIEDDNTIEQELCLGAEDILDVRYKKGGE